MCELKQCPFCGKTNRVGAVKLRDSSPHCNWERDSDGEKRAVESWVCFCANCGVKQVYAHRTREEAIRAWNTRYKRTCHLNMSNPPTRGWYCSECHVYISDEAMADASTWLKLKFCPNCGAEVVDG